MDRTNIKKFLISYLLWGTVGIVLTYMFFYTKMLESYLPDCFYWFLIMVVASLIWFDRKKYIYNWHLPIAFLFSIHVIYVVMGVLVYVARDIYWFNYSANMDIVYTSAIISVIAMILAAPICEILYNLINKTDTVYIISLKKLNSVIWFLIIVGNLATFKLFDYYTNIPLFSYNIKQAKLDASSFSAGKGMLITLMQLLTIVIPYVHYYYCTLSRQNSKAFYKFFFYWLKIFLCIIPLSFYGGRFYIILPIILVLFFHTYFFNRLSLKTILPFFVFIISISMIFVSFRIAGSSLSFATATRAIWADLFPEIRGFGMVVSYIGCPYIYKEMIVNFFIKFFPSFVLIPCGIDKQQYLLTIGRYVSENVDATLSGNAIRTGLLGESYLAGNYTGVFILHFCIASLALYFTRKLIILEKNDFRNTHFLIAGVTLSTSVVYGTNQLYTFVLITVISIIISSYASDKTKI